MKIKINSHLNFIKVFLILVILSIFMQQGRAQERTALVEKEIIKGIILEVKSNKRLANVNIHNLTNKIKSISDNKGEFSILASIGDELIFTSLAFDTVRAEIKTFGDILIDMQPNSILLGEVKVENRSKESELNEVLDSYSRHGIYQGGNPTVMSYIFMPITSLYERFSKKGKQARYFRDYANNELKATLVDRYFNRTRIFLWTELEDEDLSNFMLLYRPSFEEAQYWTEYDARKYIKESSLKFIADGKPEVYRLPRIKADTKF